MGKCYWFNCYYLYNGKRYYPNIYHGFYYGTDKSHKEYFNSFDELYDYAHISTDLKYGEGFITKKRYVVLPDYSSFSLYDGIEISEKNFKPVTFIKEYIEFTPSVQEAMRWLNVEQFKEYAGLDVLKCLMK